MLPIKYVIFHLEFKEVDSPRDMAIKKTLGWGHDIFALAFLPPDEIHIAFVVLKRHLSEEARKVKWFENNYVLGRIKWQIGNGAAVQSLLYIPPEMCAR